MGTARRSVVSLQKARSRDRREQQASLLPRLAGTLVPGRLFPARWATASTIASGERVASTRSGSVRRLRSSP